MKTSITIISTLFFGLVGLGFAHAQNHAENGDPQYRGEFRDWHLYVHEGNQGKTCYIASEPKKEDGNYRLRDQPAVLVAVFPMEPPNTQVSVQPGYPFKEGAVAEVDIDGAGYEFFTKEESGWTKSPEVDSDVIEAMKQGSEMSVRGTSQKDTYSFDTYSLMGFTAAFEAMKQACNG